MKVGPVSQFSDLILASGERGHLRMPNRADMPHPMANRGERRARDAQNRNAKKTKVAEFSPVPARVPSLLDAMQDGNEYGSIVGLVYQGVDLVPEIRRALADLENVRQRRCICYVANVIKDIAETSIHPGDHLPFAEMVDKIPASEKNIDVYLVTPGGNAEQVTQFVTELRRKFTGVEFILPYKAMSAGTLWALSGDRIWMDSRAFIGPVDPQFPAKDGGYAPAQALITLVNEIQKVFDEYTKRRQPLPFAYVRLLDQMDHQKLAHAITATSYVTKLAAEYLERYKFSSWTTHSQKGGPVTQQERAARAIEVAQIMCSHDNWKAHGHAIQRDVVFRDLQIKVDRVESVAGLERAVRRLWAIMAYTFEKTPAAKMMLSQEYSFVRSVLVQTIQTPGVPNVKP